ncbi:MAG: CBS domain-containing protein [Bacteroidia bacterium]|nr:CBS domain-containing protein [Bacteroidia bacterium]
MIAGELVTQNVMPLKTSDSGNAALALMSDYYLKHLPIVNNLDLLGLISEDDILDNDVEEAIGSYGLSLRNVYVYDYDHIYEVLKAFNLHQVTALPVVDTDEQYKGMVLQEDIVKYLANSFSVQEPGAILVLEMSRRDYSLAEMAKIVESENANILSSYVMPTPDSNIVQVTLKVNKQNLQSIIAAFQRFKYLIKASYQEVEYMDSLKERYDSLMTYLDV